MMKLRTLMAVIGLLALSAPTFAQTTLTSTTLAAALPASSTQVQVASATGIEVNDYIAIMNGNKAVEIMQVRALNGVFLTVSRSVRLAAPGGAIGHLTGLTVYHAPAGQFYNNTPVGTCTRANERYLPHINLSTGIVSQCSTAGVWYRLDEQRTVACYTGPLATHSVDQSCWTVNGDYVITGITYVSKVVESAGTLTVIPRRQQGTEAPASGDALATAISGVSTVAETVTSFTLTTTGSLLLLSSGERLGLDFTDDVAGELLGVLVTFTIAPR
jgi:hypothetical protein